MISTSPEFVELQRIVAGRYSLERELGRGGMGIVFLARDVTLERPVAIKLLPAAFANQPSLRARFVQEAKTAGRLSHPNIVTIHSVEEHEGVVFFVMAYVQGETLTQRVRRSGPLNAAQTIRLIQEVAWALGYSHLNGVIHRDVKPDNILLDSATERAMVTDFGIARITQRDTDEDRSGSLSVAVSEGQTAAGHVVGTASYMSPEQASGDKVDGRSDIYSLGATAFFAMTGRPPFEGPNPMAVMMMHVTKPAPLVTELRPRVPVHLTEIIQRCMAKDPAARFASGEKLAESVAELRGDDRAVPPLVRSFSRMLRNAGAQVFAIAAIIAMGWDRGIAPIFWHTIAPVLGIGALVILVRSLHAARQILDSGLGVDDVKSALARDQRERYEEAIESLPPKERPRSEKRVFSSMLRSWEEEDKEGFGGIL